MRTQPLSVFALCLTTIALAGCYNDPKNLEKAVADGKPVVTNLPPANGLKPDDKSVQPTPDAKLDPKKDDKKPETKSLSPAQIGLPTYPGAQPRKNPDGSERTLPVTSSAMMIEQETPDSITQVDAFYQKNFVGATRHVAQEGGSTAYQYLLSGSDKKERVVELKTEGKVTVITLAAVDAPPLPAAPTAPSTTPTKPGLPSPSSPSTTP